MPSCQSRQQLSKVQDFRALLTQRKERHPAVALLGFFLQKGVRSMIERCKLLASLSLDRDRNELA